MISFLLLVLMTTVSYTQNPRRPPADSIQLRQSTTTVLNPTDFQVYKMKPMISPFNVPGTALPIGPYSHGVAASGTMIFLSGQIPMKPDGSLVTGSIAEETEQVLRNIEHILVGKGAGIANVVKTTVFLISMGDFAEMNGVYESFFGTHKPARSTVEVRALPRGVRVEIEVVAVI